MRKSIVSVLFFFSFIVAPGILESDQLIDESVPQSKKASIPCFTKLSVQDIKACSLLVAGETILCGPTTIKNDTIIEGPTTIKNDTIIEGDLIVNGEIFCNSEPICPGGSEGTGSGGGSGTEGTEGTESGGSGTGGGGFTSNDYLFAIYNSPEVFLGPENDFIPNLVLEYSNGWQDGTEAGTFVVPTDGLYSLTYHVNFGIYFPDSGSRRRYYILRTELEVDEVSVPDARRVMNEYHELFDLDFLPFISIFEGLSSSIFITLFADSRIRLHIFNDGATGNLGGATLNFANPSNISPLTTPPPYATLTITKIADM